MQLSKRLERVASFVTPNKTVADIGCDHAYIPIYLLEHNIAQRVIAMDVRKGPLSIAAQNIERAGLAGVIETRLSDGIDKLRAGEVDTIIIAGMGGILMSEILTADNEVLDTITELVLQPQSDIDLVRKTIMKLQFRIVNEDMLIDEGKYYTIMRAVRTNEKQVIYNDVELIYGRLLLQEKNEILHQYLKQELFKTKELIRKLEAEASDSAKTAYHNLSRKKEQINTALKAFTDEAV